LIIWNPPFSVGQRFCFPDILCHLLSSGTHCSFVIRYFSPPFFPRIRSPSFRPLESLIELWRNNWRRFFLLPFTSSEYRAMLSGPPERILVKTRRFPSPPHGGFGFIGQSYC